MRLPAGERPERARRLLVLTPNYPPEHGGIQILVSRLVQNLERFEPRVVTFAEPGDADFDRATAIPARRVTRPGIPKAPNLALNAVGIREALRFHPDLVLSAHIIVGPAARAIRALRGTPFVQYLHADELWRTRLARAALGAAEASIAVSAYTRDLAIAVGADPERVRCIPPGVDLPESRHAERASRPTFITVARLTNRHKGHDVLMRAMPLIAQEVPGVEWVIIGDGPLRAELEGGAESGGLEGCVRFTGAVSDDERDAWLDRAHVLAMPSRLPPRGSGGEGFGIVYLEAGAHGLPVVAGNVAGAPDAVVDGVTGLLVDPTDPVAVAGAITDLLLDPEKAGSMGQRGRERAQEMTWPRIAKRVESVLLRAAEGSVDQGGGVGERWRTHGLRRTRGRR